MLTATSVGLGAIGYTCSATVCDGSTADMKAKFKLLQERLNAVNALIAVPPKALTVDGRLGRNTKDALIIAATTAAGYPGYAATLGKLLSYGTKPPTLAAIAASASALATELLVLRKAREKDGAATAAPAETTTLAPAAAAAQTAAEAATLRADALALVKGEAAPETVAARAAEETAKTAASAVASALNRLKPPPFGLPRITGTAQTDKLIYASAAIGALALVWYGYHKRQPATRAPAPAPAPAPAASAPVAGLRRRRRS